MLRCRTGTRRNGPMRLSSCSTACCEVLDVKILPFSGALRRLQATFAAAIILALCTAPALAAAADAAKPIYLLGIPVDFILFGLTLIGVAIFHHKTLQVALTGLA